MSMKLKIGCHLSFSQGYVDMANTAVEINANTFAFFTRNPRGGSAKAIKMVGGFDERFPLQEDYP